MFDHDSTLGARITKKIRITDNMGHEYALSPDEHGPGGAAPISPGLTATPVLPRLF
jgi:hypothetical protein